ncbi:MAG: hypothetical protein NUV69_00900 [Candidatus Curtissbacteria bacterium]|nr:hypothetical protein [Candidatus Curtissbacteria bacterium]
MKFGQGWSSYFPVLIKTVQNTDGPILELGSGLFSTPLLHWLCAEQGRKLVTYEDVQEYYKFARKFRTETHEVNFVTDWDKEDFDKKKWSVVLIDHTAKRRTTDALRLKKHAQYIVLHDTQEEAEHHYGYKKLWSKFKNIYHWEYDLVNVPRTSVVSNTSNLNIFK